jgi:cell division protein FtsZ
MTMDEIDAASSFIKEEVHRDAEIFWGVVISDDMGDEVQVTVIATGIDSSTGVRRPPGVNYHNVVKITDLKPEEIEEGLPRKKKGDSLDIPTYQRKGIGLSESVEDRESPEEKKGFLSRFHLRSNLDYPTFLRAKAD